jgi:hypothetical protein
MYALSHSVTYDTDAQAYITAVETADGQPLEVGVKVAIDELVVGCKADGIWTAIKASCILAGARTLAGALVPLVGTAPTNFNFVSGDYNRKTGLAGNGSSKYLNSNRANNADPQNSKHMAVYASSVGAVNGTYIGIATTNGSSHFTSEGTTNTIGGFNRASGTTISGRGGGSTNASISMTSTAPAAGGLLVFDGIGKSTARLAFYSIGESLNLALLDARVSALISALATAIP